MAISIHDMLKAVRLDENRMQEMLILHQIEDAGEKVDLMIHDKRHSLISSSIFHLHPLTPLNFLRQILTSSMSKRFAIITYGGSGESSFSLERDLIFRQSNCQTVSLSPTFQSPTTLFTPKE